MRGVGEGEEIQNPCHLVLNTKHDASRVLLRNVGVSRERFRSYAGQIALWSLLILSIISLQSLQWLGSSLKMWFYDTVKFDLMTYCCQASKIPLSLLCPFLSHLTPVYSMLG